MVMLNCAFSLLLVAYSFQSAKSQVTDYSQGSQTELEVAPQRT